MPRATQHASRPLRTPPFDLALHLAPLLQNWVNAVAAVSTFALPYSYAEWYEHQEKLKARY